MENRLTRKLCQRKKNTHLLWHPFSEDWAPWSPQERHYTKFRWSRSSHRRQHRRHHMAALCFGNREPPTSCLGQRNSRGQELLGSTPGSISLLRLQPSSPLVSPLAPVPAQSSPLKSAPWGLQITTSSWRHSTHTPIYIYIYNSSALKILFLNLTIQFPTTFYQTSVFLQQMHILLSPVLPSSPLQPRYFGKINLSLWTGEWMNQSVTRCLSPLFSNVPNTIKMAIMLRVTYFKQYCQALNP